MVNITCHVFISAWLLHKRWDITLAGVSQRTSPSCRVIYVFVHPKNELYMPVILYVQVHRISMEASIFSSTSYHEFDLQVIFLLYSWVGTRCTGRCPTVFNGITGTTAIRTEPHANHRISPPGRFRGERRNKRIPNGQNVWKRASPACC